MNSVNEDDLRLLAQRRVQARNGFVQHLIAYAVINAGLVVLWLATGRGYPWFIWPLVGWGVAIVFHAIDVTVKLRSPEREERAVQKELSRIRSGRGPHRTVS